MLRNTRPQMILALLLATGLWLVGAPQAANAGCGCDHPPPAWAQVMPPFGSPGAEIVIFSAPQPFMTGKTYTVDFTVGGETATRSVEAELPDQLRVLVPHGLGSGPATIHVTGLAYNHIYSDDLFTLLPKARKVPEQSGTYRVQGYEAAISRDGTVYVPLDASDVLDATQFAFAFQGFPLEFGAEDVVIYNRDGFDLTLFTLDVGDENFHQWGEYFGWDVEVDQGIIGTIYDSKVEVPTDAAAVSNIFTYWRHEFHTYAAAHVQGGSHEVNLNGLHPDGTLHVDHDHLVIAISGQERSTSGLQPLVPGGLAVELAWVTIETELPVDPGAMADFAEFGVGEWSEELLEVLDTRVAQGNDDAEERLSDGDMSRSSSDLDLGEQLAGLRFADLSLPKGATILNAYVQFQVEDEGGDSGTAAFLIEGQADDNPPAFRSADYDISSRPRASASVSWLPPDWTNGGWDGFDQRTPDLSEILQEIVDRPGWTPGNAFVLLFSGSGERDALSYNADPGGAAELHVEYAVTPPSGTMLEVQVASLDDDAEESSSGSVGLDSSDLDLGEKAVGMRFPGVEVPAGATIQSAYIQFQAEDPDAMPTDVAIDGEAVDDAAPFAAIAYDVTSRPRTSASASWSIPAWTSDGEAGLAQRTPDLAAVIQEIVDRPGWAMGHALVIVMEGSGKRDAEDAGSVGAPVLHVEFGE